MQFFILAGGYGTRAKPLSLIKPKCLFPLNGTPLLGIILDQLYSKGLLKGFVNLHYLPGQIIEFTKAFTNIKLDFLTEEILSGSKILKSATPATDDLLLVVNGDLFMDIPIESMHKKLVDNQADGVLLVRKSSDPGYSNLLTRRDLFLGKKPGEPGEKLMYTGVALFRKKVVLSIEDESFFSSLARNSFKILVQETRGLWLDFGEPHHYFRANEIYRKKIKAKGSNSISGDVKISGDSIINNSIIWEKCEISDGTRLNNCIVTGNVSISRSEYHDKIITGNGIFNLFPVSSYK